MNVTHCIVRLHKKCALGYPDILLFGKVAKNTCNFFVTMV